MDNHRLCVSYCSQHSPGVWAWTSSCLRDAGQNRRSDVPSTPRRVAVVSIKSIPEVREPELDLTCHA